MNTDTSLIVISAPIVTLIVALLIPIVNGYFTKITLSGGVKGLITLVLNTLVAFITTATTAEGTAVFSKQTAYTAAVGFIISVASYVGIYKPADLTSSEPDGKLSPNSGIG
jgi:uncharacterized membrane protein YvlD (DUF360 family)